MPSRLTIEAVTLIPSLVMFVTTIYISGLMLYVVEDYGELRLLSIFSLSFFYAGLVFAICWFIYWGLYRGVTGKDGLGSTRFCPFHHKKLK